MCARLLALDEATTRAVPGIAANAACGFDEWARAGTQEHVPHSAMAARAGVEPALLASAGLTASGAVVDGASGLLAAFGARSRARRLTAGLATRFAIRDIVHEPAPACAFVQGLAGSRRRSRGGTAPIRPTSNPSSSDSPTRRPARLSVASVHAACVDGLDRASSVAWPLHTLSHAEAWPHSPRSGPPRARTPRPA
ncbi:hypothetical protein GTY80_52740 [Amycolatopsis sp. SID8362]|uniref:MmgE/PrpD family protein n=1 Tax=Amycolatopsis sp. SID8362 TaxID=2690346 RepID=UPI00136F222D|nr:hypothetical protein [Amycolatopsis sp. SID8362]NED48588.1 MmgE/PrpD family protein [Amycolatopsis sp. SID8362]